MIGKCEKCGKEKLIKQPKKAIKLCHSCRNYKDWVSKNKEKVKKSNKIWREKNKSYFKIYYKKKKSYWKIYYQKNRKKRLEYQLSYVKKKRSEKNVITKN